MFLPFFGSRCFPDSFPFATYAPKSLLLAFKKHQVLLLAFECCSSFSFENFLYQFIEHIGRLFLLTEREFHAAFVMFDILKLFQMRSRVYVNNNLSQQHSIYF
jgi:hypothetical protein